MNTTSDEQRNVYFVQVNWSNCAGNAPGYWVPYSVGSLWAYAQAIPEIAKNYCLRDIIFERQPIVATSARFEKPNVIGFSTYVWNEQYNLKLAKTLREQWPEALIVFGGPQVPNNGQQYFQSHSFIDVLVHSEGEDTFARILRERLNANPKYDTVNGCSLNQKGRTVKTEPAERLKVLSDFPSPYLSGVFDPLFAQYPDADWNAVIENNRGCPYRCTFCDWGTLTYSKVVQFPLQRVLDEIEWLARRRVSYVMPADANFGMFSDRDMQIADHFVACRQRTGYPMAVGMAFAKNSNNRILEIAERLHNAGLLKALTLSAQSMDTRVLDAIKRRNMAISDFASLLHECNRRSIPTYTELILGLPEETLSSWKGGLCEALECGQHNQLESWLLEMLENAPLNHPETIKQYGLKTIRLKNYSFVFDKQEDEEAPEEIPIVYETASMPYADFQLAMGFSMIIYNLHAYGWTQFIARFLRQEYSVSYFEFYSRLEAWIRRQTGTILHREYSKTIETLCMMVETGNYVVDRWLLNTNVGSVPLGLRSQGFFHIEANTTHQAIEDFVTDEFGAVLGDMLDEALRFQRHFVTSPDRTYPYEESFARDFLGVLSENEIQRPKVNYKFDTILQFSSIESYLALIYSKKKQGFGKAKITAVIHASA